MDEKRNPSEKVLRVDRKRRRKRRKSIIENQNDRREKRALDGQFKVFALFLRFVTSSSRTV